MLFKPEHIKMILAGTKTATRRDWKKPMVKVGGVYKVKTKMLSNEYHCKIKVLKLYKQQLGNMTLEDVIKEGYQTWIDFREIWVKINYFFAPKKVVDVVEFELYKGGE